MSVETRLAPHYDDDETAVYLGDCLDVLRALPDESVDAVVTDPPYGLSNTDPAHVVEALGKWLGGDRTFLPSTGGGFMGKAWDSFVPPPAVWDEALRVLKPGGHLLAFAGSRTQDLMGLSIRLAGFDVRDNIAWLYGSGFPKSMDVSKAIDKHLDIKPAPDLTLEWDFTTWARSTGVTAQAMNEATGSGMGSHYLTAKSQPQIPTRIALEALRPLFDEIPQWVEDVVDLRDGEKLAAAERQKSARFLEEIWGDAPEKVSATDAAREWEGWGTALKPAHEPIIVARKPFSGTVAANVLAHGTGALNIDATRVETTDSTARVRTRNEAMPGDDRTNSGKGAMYAPGHTFVSETHGLGRWPANVMLDESQAAALDAQTGVSKSVRGIVTSKPGSIFGGGAGLPSTTSEYGYNDQGGASRFFYVAKAPTSERPKDADGNGHSTVKPLALMRQLVRLVTPPGGVVLEPFAGSGTTIEAAILEGFRVIGIEREVDYWPLIRQRIARGNGVEG